MAIDIALVRHYDSAIPMSQDAYRIGDVSLVEGSRKTGIDVVGDVPWGTHFCHLCQTKKDLIGILVPYFRSGLENNEFCLWVTSCSLAEKDARKVMAKAIPGFARYVAEGQIEIVPHDRWYLKDGVLDLELVLRGWVDKLDSALARGYSGMRVSGNMAWLEKKDWTTFVDYEAAVNDVIGKYKMLALCTYWQDKCGAAEAIKVVRNHGFALVSQKGVVELVGGNHRQLKKALVLSEEGFGEMYEQSPIGIELYDNDGGLKGVNKACLDIMGVSSIDEAKGFNIIEDPSVTDEVKDRLHKGETVRLEMVLDSREAKRGGRAAEQGSTSLDVQLTQLGARGEHAADGYIVQIQDVTQRRWAERLLQSSETRYRRLFEAAQDGILILDADTGRITDTNQHLGEMLGYSHDELLGKAVWEIGPLKDTLLNQEAFRRLQNNGYAHYEHLPLESKDGRRVDVEFVNNIYLENGEKVVQCNVREITQRRMAEESLFWSEERFRQVAESAGEWIWEVDTEGLYVYASPVVEKILGYKPDEVVGKMLFFNLFIPEAREGLKKLTFETFAKHELLRGFRNPCLHKNGTTIILEMNGGPVLDDHGRLLGYRGVCTDVTEREMAKQRLEEALRRTEGALLATIRAIALTIEKRDPYLSSHHRRVTQLASVIADEMGLSSDKAESIRMAGLLHDLGKMQIPIEILSKPVPLTRAEFALIKTHPQISYEILTAAEFPAPVPDVVLQHHERIDGSGYPAGLRNGQILLEANVLAVADVVEAISSNRPYRPALGVARALDEIYQNRGVIYDPEVVDACVKVFAEKEFAFEE